VIGQFGDRGGAVTTEPLGLDLTRLHPSGQRNLERALPQGDPGCLTDRQEQLVVDQTVIAVDLPIELFLLRNHVSMNSRVLLVCVVNMGS